MGDRVETLMSANRAGAIRTQCARTHRVHLSASAGLVTAEMASTAPQRGPKLDARSSGKAYWARPASILVGLELKSASTSLSVTKMGIFCPFSAMPALGCAGVWIEMDKRSLGLRLSKAADHSVSPMALWPHLSDPGLDPMCFCPRGHTSCFLRMAE